MYNICKVVHAFLILQFVFTSSYMFLYHYWLTSMHQATPSTRTSAIHAKRYINIGQCILLNCLFFWNILSLIFLVNRARSRQNNTYKCMTCPSTRQDNPLGLMQYKDFYHWSTMQLFLIVYFVHNPSNILFLANREIDRWFKSMV